MSQEILLGFQECPYHCLLETRWVFFSIRTAYQSYLSYTPSLFFKLITLVKLVSYWLWKFRGTMCGKETKKDCSEMNVYLILSRHNYIPFQMRPMQPVELNLQVTRHLQKTEFFSCVTQKKSKKNDLRCALEKCWWLPFGKLCPGQWCLCSEIFVTWVVSQTTTKSIFFLTVSSYNGQWGLVYLVN